MKGIKTIAAVILTLSVSIAGHSQSLKDSITTGNWYSANDLNLSDTINLQHVVLCMYNKGKLKQGLHYLTFNSDSTLSGLYKCNCRPWLISDRIGYWSFRCACWFKIGTWEISKKHIEIFLNNKKLDCKVEHDKYKQLYIESCPMNH